MNLTRRGLIQLMGRAVALGGGAVLLAACAQPAPTPTPEPAKPAEAPKPAAPAAAPTPTPAPAKPAEAPKVLAPTPTPVPVYTPIPQPAGTTKILMRVHWSGSNLNDLQKILSDYNLSQGAKDKIYVALERFVAGQAGPIATFIADFQAGTQEDVYHLSDTYLADLASRNFFREPPQEIQNYIKENFLISAVKNGTWQGKILGYPTENQPHMVFLNKKLFEAAGLDATKDYPKKWDDIRTLAQKLTKREGGLKVQAGYVVHDAQGERIHTQRLLFQYLSGEPLLDDSVTPPKYNVTSPAARAWTELYANMAQDGTTSIDMGQYNIIWQQRKGAMMTADAWQVNFQLMREGVPGILDEQHTIPCFSLDGSKTGNVSRNYHFLASSKTKSTDQVWTFLKWFNEGPEFRMQEFQTNTFGFVASVKNYPLPKFFPEQMKQAFSESLKTPYQTSYAVIRGLNEVLTILRDHHDALCLKKETADEYTKKVDEELKAALAKAYAT